MGATFFNLAGLLLKGRGTFIAEARVGVKESMRTAGEEGGDRVSGIGYREGRRLFIDKILFHLETRDPIPDTPLHVPRPTPETLYPEPCSL